MHCGTHGHSERVIACCHVRRGGRLRLFVVPADDECELQAWCGTCERARMKDHGWHDHASGVADWAYICSGCFEFVASRAISLCELPAVETPEAKADA